MADPISESMNTYLDHYGMGDHQCQRKDQLFGVELRLTYLNLVTGAPKMKAYGLIYPSRKLLQFKFNSGKLTKFDRVFLFGSVK